MRRVILLGCLLMGCGNDGSGLAGVPAGGTGGAQASGGAGGGGGIGSGGTGGSSGGSGAPGAGGSGTGGASGTGGSATGGAPAAGGSAGSDTGTGGAGGGSLPPDAGGALLSCPQAQNFQATLCGFAGPHFVTWVGKWKDGLECSVCTSVVGQHTACTVDKGSRTTEGPGPLLCVQSCGACCYRAATAPCSSDADCCAPMHCQAGDAGGKSCR